MNFYTATCGSKIFERGLPVFHVGQLVTGTIDPNSWIDFLATCFDPIKLIYLEV